MPKDSHQGRLLRQNFRSPRADKWNEIAAAEISIRSRRPAFRSLSAGVSQRCSVSRHAVVPGQEAITTTPDLAGAADLAEPDAARLESAAGGYCKRR